MTLITSSNCASCKNVLAIWRQVREHVGFQFEEVDITSSRGRDLAARHNIFTTPVTIVDDQVVMQGPPKIEHQQRLRQAVNKQGHNSKQA